jgi:hypothetical protein
MEFSDCSPYPRSSCDVQQAPHLLLARATILSESEDEFMNSKYDELSGLPLGSPHTSLAPYWSNLIRCLLRIQSQNCRSTLKENTSLCWRYINRALEHSSN